MGARDEISEMARRCGWDAERTSLGNLELRKDRQELRVEFNAIGYVKWARIWEKTSLGGYRDRREAGGQGKREQILDILAGPNEGTVMVHEIAFLQGEEGAELAGLASNTEGVVVHGPTRESVRAALGRAREYVSGEPTEDMVFHPEGHELILGRDTAREGDLVIQWHTGLSMFGIYEIIREA